MIRKLAFLIVFVFITNGSVLADKWSYPKKRSEYVHEFGTTKVVRIIDATENQQYPEFSIDILTNEKLVGRYRFVTFDHIFASKDNALFVGLSNSGLPGTAIIVFDSRGSLRLEIKHSLGHFDYCAKSVTVAREWYNHQDPEFTFEYEENGNVKDMTLRLCNGNKASLVQVIENAYNKPLQQTSESGG